jgi:hypothetical protein
LITAIVEIHGGAWPSSCHPDYPMDGEAYLRYVEQAGTDGYQLMLEEWLQHFSLSQ